MNIAEKSGFTKTISKFLSPLLSKLFPGVKKDSKTMSAISMNVSANMLGLGNAATPLGLRAMKELQNENPLKDTASKNMITFVVLNSVSVQIIPTGMMVLRSKFGSSNPSAILAAVWITSIVSAVIGLTIAFVMSKRKTGKRYELK